MGRGGFVGFLFVVLIVARGSCYSLGDIVRVLSSEGGHQVEPAKIDGGSPSPSPLPVVKKDSAKGASEEKRQSQPDGGAKSGSLGGDQVGKHDSSKKTGDGEKKGAEGVEKNGDNKDKTSSVHSHGKNPAEEDCVLSAYSTCHDQHGLTACLLRGESGKVYILVKNEGDTKLNVTIKVPPSLHISNTTLQLEKHHHEKVNVSFKNHFNPQIVIDAGHEKCPLQPGMLFSAGSILQNLPYTVTPAYGAYALLLTTVIAGGVWACCKFGKRTRRSGDGVPYRELEMGIPQSSTAINVDTMEGWDQGWDDDWDDRPIENSSDRQIRTLSENGLSSRSGKKEKWDKDWDD